MAGDKERVPSMQSNGRSLTGHVSMWEGSRQHLLRWRYSGQGFLVGPPCGQDLASGGNGRESVIRGMLRSALSIVPLRAETGLQ
jgi:hypothetical protein